MDSKTHCQLLTYRNLVTSVPMITNEFSVHSSVLLNFSLRYWITCMYLYSKVMTIDNDRLKLHRDITRNMRHCVSYGVIVILNYCAIYTVLSKIDLWIMNNKNLEYSYKYFSVHKYLKKEIKANIFTIWLYLLINSISFLEKSMHLKTFNYVNCLCI